MTDNDTPWEPPLAGTEPAQLLGALERLRTTFRWKADDLDIAGLQATVGASTLTIGGLLKHLAINEDVMFAVKMRGEPLGAPWTDSGWDRSHDWAFTSAPHDKPEYLLREAVDGRVGEDPPSGWQPRSGSYELPADPSD